MRKSQRWKNDPHVLRLYATQEDRRKGRVRQQVKLVEELIYIGTEYKTNEELTVAGMTGELEGKEADFKSFPLVRLDDERSEWTAPYSQGAAHLAPGDWGNEPHERSERHSKRLKDRPVLRLGGVGHGLYEDEKHGFQASRISLSVELFIYLEQGKREVTYDELRERLNKR